jgi:putative DNA primase/helicase
MTIDEITQRLKNVRKVSGGWEACCPAHDDSSPSLSISEGQDGRVLLNCHAGCQFSQIVSAMGLQKSDFFQKRDKPQHSGQSRRVVAQYRYTDENDRLLYEKQRIEPGKNGRKKDFNFRIQDDGGQWSYKLNGTRRVLYHLPDVCSAIEEGRVVFLVEGEKDSDALVSLGVCATSHDGGAGKWTDTYTETLSGANVVLVADKDEPGRNHGELVASALNGTAKSVRVIELPDRDGNAVKDAADWIAAGGTKAELRSLVKDARVWAPEETIDSNKKRGTPIDAAKVGAPFAMTDLGNAERLCAWHRDSLRWDTARRTWRVWDGQRWAVDSSLEVQRLAADTARKIRREAINAPARSGETKDMGEALFSWAVKSESRDKLGSMLEVAKSQPGVAVSGEVWDTDPYLLNVANGTIELRTGSLRKHDRSDMITKLSPVAYDPAREDTRWDRFLQDAAGGDAELIRFLQIAAGYTLTGDTTEEKLFLVYGPTAGGKSTFLESVRSVLGDYARTIQADLLAKQNPKGGSSPSPELAGLAGARLAAGSEMEQGREIAEALAKNLTGGEPITARHLYAELFDFRPQFKLWLALNHCPRVSADDDAVWRRILRVGFEHTVPPERRDRTLKPYLRHPDGGAPAVLAWAVAGCVRWQREGLKIPEVVERSTQAYRSESDPLALFIEDCLEFNPNAWTTWKDIRGAYSEHAEENGTPDRYRVSPKRIQDRLKSKECLPDRRYAGRGWAGVELKTGWKTEDHDGHDGYDTSFRKSQEKDYIEKVCEQASYPSEATCDEGDSEERAAILEFDAGLSRDDAETQALELAGAES